MTARCAIGTAAVFAAGALAGLVVASQAASKAGCPSASGLPLDKSPYKRPDRLADAAEEVAKNLRHLKNLENLRQRGSVDAAGGGDLE